MPIIFSRAFVSNGIAYASLRDAQVAEIEAILTADTQESGEGCSPKDLAEIIVSNADRFVDILTTSESSRPTARRVNGGRKPRKTKATTNTTEDDKQPVQT